MSPELSAEAATRRFLEIEAAHDLLSLRSDGAPAWEYIRFGAQQELLRKLGIHQLAHAKEPRDVLARVRQLPGFLKSVTVRNPSRMPKCELLFVGHPRRKISPGGVWQDIYCDPLKEGLAWSFAHLEAPYLGRHLEPTRDKVYHSDAFRAAARVRRILRSAHLSPSAARALEAAERAFREEMGATLPLRDMAAGAIAQRASLQPSYRRLLARTRPRAIALTVSYGKEALIEVARELELPTIELQHGTLYAHHLGYSFPGRGKTTFPDAFFSFGEFWRRLASFPLKADAYRNVGFAYFEDEVARVRATSSRQDQILFISQGVVGDKLSRLAVETAALTSADVVFKLHPGEYARWRHEYPWLLGSKVRVVDSDRESLYELLSSAAVQVGVFSTALYEGIGFGLRTLIADLPGAEYMRPVIDAGAATAISSAEDILAATSRASAPTAASMFFRPGARANFQDELRRVI